MPFVVDASVTMAWCFEDEVTDDTDEVLRLLATDTALVPALWSLEVANVLTVAERRGRVTESQTARLVQLLGQLPISIDQGGFDIGGLVAVARAHGLSAYDAAYLALAEREGLPLATLDVDLRRAAQAAGVRLLF